MPTNQTQLLVSDSPEGPYTPLVKDHDFCLGPKDWDIIDGTLYQENDTTYMVFVHEWTQLIDGTMAYMPLSKDLTHRTAEPTTIFRASEAFVLHVGLDLLHERSLQRAQFLVLPFNLEKHFRFIQQAIDAGIIEYASV